MTDKNSSAAAEEAVQDFMQPQVKIPLETRPDEWLGPRYKLGTMLIGMIADDPDPRTPAAIDRLNSQKQEILDEMIRRGLKPPNQTVSMKTIEWSVSAPAVG